MSITGHPSPIFAIGEPQAVTAAKMAQEDLGHSRFPYRIVAAGLVCAGGENTGRQRGMVTMTLADGAPGEPGNSVLEEAARELEAAAHDARVAFDCVALGEIDRAHTSALTARVAADAAITALQAALKAAGKTTSS
jgi:hypothetical protein